LGENAEKNGVTPGPESRMGMELLAGNAVIQRIR
jgi:hypothetical protein